MNTATHLPASGAPGTGASVVPGTVPLSSDHQFALLTARAGLEPELAQRYTSDPVSVLAEFGLPATEPVYGDGFAEVFAAVYGNAPGDTGRAVVIDHLDRQGAVMLYGCATGMAPVPAETVLYGCATGMAPLPEEAVLYGCATGMAPLPDETTLYGCATGMAPLPDEAGSALA